MIKYIYQHERSRAIAMTKEQYMERFFETEATVDQEIKRLQEAPQGSKIFTQHKPVEYERISALIGLAQIPYYYGCRCDAPTTFYKGPYVAKI